MKKTLTPFPETTSADLVIENIAQLKALFPEAFAEGKINFDVLRQLLGSAVDESEEKFGLSWHGKRLARQIALTPSNGTLRPCPLDGVEWDTTHNIMIEGDNLEALKLLKKSYAGKVKLIYIDPPYNTGNDFVYPDDFQNNIKNYLELTGQVQGGKKIGSNTEASGRFHTDWLNMMYPRLKVASTLLRTDGIVCVSIDDSEVANLRKICDEIFGEENFLQQMVWKRHAGGGNDSKHFATDHEYILVYAKNKAAIDKLRIPLSDEDRAEYKFSDQHVETHGPYKLKSFRRMRPDDPRPTLEYDIEAPDGATLRDTWKWEKPRFIQALADDKVQIRKDRNDNWQVEYKIYLNSVDEDEIEERMKVPRSLILEIERNADGKRQLRETLGEDNVFSNPKPIGLIAHLMSFCVGSDDIILDFFAGSGTTGHAVMAQNVKDVSKRRFVLVQLPEPLSPEDKDQKVAAAYCDKLSKPRNIAEITKERLRRASMNIKVGAPSFKGDLGFRVFKLDSSNIRAWEPKRNDLVKTLDESMEHIKRDRTEQDILFELLLKLGLDLIVPIEEKKIVGKAVYNIGAGTLFVCLDMNIAVVDVEALALGIVAWYKQLAPGSEPCVVFRDSAFADDVAKTNLTTILQQHGMDNVRSL